MKKLLSIAAAALLTLALTSCGESDSSAKKVRIGVSIPAADHGWTGGVVWYAEKAKRDLEKSDPNLEITVSTARDAAEQVSKIENLLVQYAELSLSGHKFNSAEIRYGLHSI